MKLSRVLMGRVAGVAACFTLVALGGCGSSGAQPDAANGDGGGAREASVPMPGSRACADGDWCAELPSNFVGVPMLVGSQPVVRFANTTYVRRASEWTRVVCPADSGTTNGPELFASDSNVTIARCGTRRYRWSADGFAPIDWPAGAVEQSGGVFGLPDVVFSIAQRDGNRFVVRCTDAGCDMIESDSVFRAVQQEIFARSADEFWVFDSGSTAWQHGATGWNSVPLVSVPRAPDVQWPPEPGASCLSDGRWVSCTPTSDRDRFFAAETTPGAVIAYTPLGEVVLFDGRTTERLRAVSARSFTQDNWPGVDVPPFAWAAPSAIDGVRDGAADRLFMVFAVGLYREGIPTPFPQRQKLFSKVGDGPWLAVPGGEFEPSGAPCVAASSPASVWVCAVDGIRHLVSGSWSTVVGRYWKLCPLSDGSVIAEGANGVTHASATGAVGESMAASSIAVCTHDDVWAESNGSLVHWAGGRWSTEPSPIEAGSREFGQSDLGITVRNRDGSAAYVWDGSAWLRRDEANASFSVVAQRVRFATREWKLLSPPVGTLLYRDRR